MDSLLIAMVCHEANRAYCEVLGDPSQKPWPEAPDWQKDSALAGVLAVKNTPGITPEQLHESWCKQKVAEGWSYGPAKNAETKEHPCLVPYAALPEFQRKKDALFGAIVRALMA